MKADIHPTYYPDAKVTCACGNTFTIGSTLPELQIELCAKCHPFYTGKQKLVDTARRVEKFAEKVAAKGKTTASGKKAKTAKRVAQKEAKKAQKKPTKLDETV
jgi:large subunit ribosomal protein L31